MRWRLEGAEMLCLAAVMSHAGKVLFFILLGVCIRDKTYVWTVSRGIFIIGLCAAYSHEDSSG